MDAIQECQKEINRLRYYVRSYEAYIEVLQKLLEENMVEYPQFEEEW